MDETRSSCPLHVLHKIEHLLLAAPSLIQPVNPPSTPALAIHSIVLSPRNISIQVLIHSFIDLFLRRLILSSHVQSSENACHSLAKNLKHPRSKERLHLPTPALQRKCPSPIQAKLLIALQLSSSNGHDQIMTEFCSNIVCSISLDHWGPSIMGTARSCSTIIEYTRTS